MWHCQSVSVVCVPSVSVVQPLDCWSDPMAGAEPTLWGSGASRRRQSVPDDLHISQSCPGDSEQVVSTQYSEHLGVLDVKLKGVGRTLADLTLARPLYVLGSRCHVQRFLATAFLMRGHGNEVLHMPIMAYSEGWARDT